MQEQRQAVQRMQDYIAAHLREEITPAQLARAACFSPWYARRLFIQHTGLSPADYVRRLRLRYAALTLRDERHSITDVAMEMGFGSVDGFIRAFQREFGRSPGAYAAKPTPLYLFNPYGVMYSKPERRKSMEVKSVFVQVVEKPERKVILKRGKTATHYWTYCEEVGCDVWGLLTSIPSIGGEPVCLWLPQMYIQPGTSEYVQGVEVPLDYDGEIPAGFEVIMLPAARYLMFQGEPFEEEDFNEAIGQVQQAIARYNPAVMGYCWDPDNPRIQLEPIGERGYIELHPIKEYQKPDDR